MGAAQATDVLEVLRLRATGWTWRSVVLQRPHVRLRGLFTRELSIAEASFVLMASFFVSALLGAVRQVLFNAQFGAGTEANAYYAAFRLPDTLFSLVAGGALSSAMIPVLLSVDRDEGEAGEWRLTSLVLTTLVAFFALVMVVGELFTPAFITRLLAPGFDAETSQLTIALTRIMLLQTVVLAAGSVATAVLNSRNQFLLTAISVASHNIALIAGIAASALFPSLGIYGPTLGVVGGAVLQVLILLPGLMGREFRFHFAWDLSDTHLREVIRLLIPNGLSVGVNYAGFILDTAFASTARETAALPAITNAWLLAGLPIALLGQAVGQSAFPRLAAHVAAGEWGSMRRTLFRSLGAAVALALPAVVAMLLLGRLTIQILFEHGKYDAAAGALTYAVLVPYSIGLPFFIGTEVITRGLIALRDTRTPLITNTLQLIGRGALMALLVGGLGVVAIPLAFVTSASVETLALGTVLLVKLQRRLRGFVPDVTSDAAVALS
jgi:putative peptidoglycan lipid II flippase